MYSIRKFKFFHMCCGNTPGFSKEQLKTEITSNDLFMIDGNKNLMVDTQLIRECRIHEAIQLPPRVQINTIQWSTHNGITILKCKNSE